MKTERKCLECPEREEYVSTLESEGFSEVYVRQMNRYIDEFVRVCRDQHAHSCPSHITRSQIEGFAQHVADSTFSAITDNPARKVHRPIKPGTAITKISVVLRWLEWLAKAGKIEGSPAAGLNAQDLFQQRVTSSEKRTTRRYPQDI